MSMLRRRSIGFVFQFYNLIPNLNAEENIMLPLLLDGQKMEHLKDRLDQILEVVGLTDRRRHTPRELSGGQQQRVAIARAIYTHPTILLGDELTGNLDSTTSISIMKFLKKMCKKYRQTMIIVTHDERIAAMADRIIQMKDGRVV